VIAELGEAHSLVQINKVRNFLGHVSFVEGECALTDKHTVKDYMSPNFIVCYSSFKDSK
jgi:hypothetical protein